MDTIVVTASRAPLAKTDLGSAITIITREQIERRQARYVTDLLRTVPGFAVSHSGTIGSQTQVRIRGAEANHVLVLIDGIRANDPASGDEFRWELLSTSNVERIEIVRGPQSSLWGSDALAGVVHIITRSGSGQPELGGYVEGGSHSAMNTALQGGVGGDNWSMGFGMERLDTDGTNISRLGSERDESEMTTASATGHFQPSDKLDFSLGIRTVDAYSQFDPVDFFVTGLPVDGDMATDSRQTNVQASGTLATLDGKVRHHLSAHILDTNNKNLLAGNQDSSTASQRMTVTYQSDIQIDKNLLSLAIEHESTRFEQRGQIGFGDPNQDQETSVNSVAADYQGRSIDRLTWLLSARYDDYSDFENALSGRLSVAWELSDATRLRANVGTGQKAPTFIERFGFYPGQFISNPDLKPEKSTSFDIGIEKHLYDEKVEVQVAVFNQDLEDEINGLVFDPATFSFTAANMDGNSSRKGVELSANFKPADYLELNGSYTYTDSSESVDQGSEVSELRRPRHAGSLGVNFRFPDEKTGLNLVADYGGSRTDMFYPPYPVPSEIVMLESYWLLGITANYRISQSVDAYVRASNLLDEGYEQVFGYRAPGRATYVGVRARFGQ